MRDCVIRPARITDYSRICELAEHMDRMHREGLPDRFRKPDGPNRARGYVESLVADPDTFLAVAEVRGAVAGLINCGLGRSPEVPVKRSRRFLKVRGLVVDEAQRRQGIGGALLDAAMSWAAGRGAEEVQLSVYEFNSDAAAFYRSRGFAPLDRRYVRPLGRASG
ncbi:MAG: GNAT family N-acetyltransferase [bacterium]